MEVAGDYARTINEKSAVPTTSVLQGTGIPMETNKRAHAFKREHHHLSLCFHLKLPVFVGQSSWR
jgi:hypothetical protein